MFDGLKDKLGSFREEAEEAAEENAEPVDPDEDADVEEAVEAEEDVDDGVDGDAAGPAPDAAGAASDVGDDVGSSDGTDARAETDVEAAADASTEPDSGATADASPATDPDPATDADAPAETDPTAEPSPAAESDPAADSDRAADAGADPAAEPAAESDAAGTDTADSDPADSDPAGSDPAASDAADSDTATSDPDADPDPDDADEAAGDDLDVADGPTIVYPDSDDEDDESDAEPEADEVEADDADDSSGGTSLTKKAKSLTRGKFVIEEEDLEGPLQDLEMALLAGDVEMEVAQELTDRIREELVGETRTFTTGTGEVVEDALRSALLDVVGVGQFDFDERIAEADKPVVIVFTGVNGVGKTTSIAKLSRYFEERGYDSVMANGDTFRAGANEQIEEHAENLDTELITHEQGGDPAAVIYDGVEYAEAHDIDVVLGDTAGRLHTSEGLMDQLAKIDRVVEPDMTLFVDEAVAGQDAVNRAREFDDAAAIDGSILTKADADSSGGAAISISHVTGKPILFLGTGQGYDDLERFDPEWLVDQLLEE